MALQIAAVANSIAALAVASLTIKDIDEIPAEVGARTSMLIPCQPLISNFSMTRDSTGGGSTAMRTVTYTLNYRLCYKPLGSGRNNGLEFVSGLVAMVSAIWDAVLAIDTFTGGIDIEPLDIANMDRPVEDPAGNAYFGCDLSFRVMEFVN